MSMTVPLPASLHARLVEVARRIRRYYFLRGISWLALTLALLAGAALLGDYLLRESLPAAVRGGLLAVWCAVGGLFLVGLARRLIRPFEATELAAVIEARFPELGERLTSSVELCQNAESGNGSPELIALLVQETDARTGKLDVTAAIPWRSTALVAGLAAVVVLATLAPAAVAPAKYGRLAQRFFVPWHTPAPPADFTFQVEPGDVFAACGRPLTISALLFPRDDLQLPRKAALVVVGEQGTSRYDLLPDEAEPARYSAALRVPGDVRYHVEAGNARSDEYTISAVTPVELAPDSPKVTVTPPSYAASVIDGEVVAGMVDIACLQYSQIALEFRFTRPAVAATLEWTTPGEVPTLIPLTLAEDGTAARHVFRAERLGSYRLLLDAEHQVRTERDGGAISVRVDQPPAALRFVGPEGPRAAREFDRLPLEIRLADDIAVAGAELEYRVDNEPNPHVEPMALEGSREAVGKLNFSLAGKVKVGQELHYRIRFRDNFPKEFGGPHVGYHPAEGWLKLRIVAEGGSLKEQDIRARRDEINKKLDEILANLKQEQRKILSIKADTRQEESLNERDQKRVDEAKQLNQQTEKALRELAREMSEDPGGDKLAEQARDVARQEMRETEQRLQEASKPGTRSGERDQKFQEAMDELDRAMTRVDRMRDLNAQLAKERQAQARIESLADRQRQLAEQAEQQAQKQDRSAEETAQLQRQQEEVARELQQLTESNPALKKALEEARAELAKQAAEKARELAQAQRDLTQASEETEKHRERERLAELARKQQELAKKAEALAQDTANPARANLARPLQPADAKKAAESLQQGKTDQAVQQQDSAARELDRLAADLERGAELARDPKVAARQLARIEENIAQRLRDPAVRQSDEKLAGLRREQQTVREAAEKLSVPNKAELQAEKKKAEESLSKAEQAIEQKNFGDAQNAMEKARQSLRELSNKMPSLEERLAQARKELSKLSRDQDEATRLAKDASKLPEAARKQEEVAKGLEKLDTPGQEPRRDRARESAQQAQEQLTQRNRPEAQARQADTKRELERLAQALAGQKPIDEKAAELARRQRDLAEQAREPDLSKPQQDQLRRAQRQLADETHNLEAKERPQERSQAVESTRRAAEEASKQGPTSPESQRAMDEAAKKLNELARRLGADPSKSEPSKALPSKEQAEMARQLAQQQRQLRDATRQSGEQLRAERQQPPNAGTEEASRKLAQEQADIARQAEQLAREVAREQGEQASSAQRASEAGRSSQEAARNRQAGALERAQEAGRQAAERFRQLANELAKTPRGENAQGDTLEQARRLAQRQEALNKQAQPSANDPSAQRAQQRSRQAELSRQAGELGRELEQIGSSSDPTRQAAQAARQAEQQMRAANDLSRQGNQSAAQQQREQAARNLEQAARQAEQAAQQANPTSPSGQAGRAVQQARNQMRRANQAMQGNQPNEAQQAMEQAANNLQQAAQQLAQAMQPRSPSNPSERGAPGGGAVDTRLLPKELAQYSGKKWGELPGEVQTKITQQMKARYGDDYARMIKLYFEQIADTRKPRSNAR